MKTYIIYRHTINKKSYIGYSSKTLEERLKDHIKESINGSDRHFHRAIRKYGTEHIISEVIDTVVSRETALEKERHYITIHDTFRNGYNMTLGGDGGNTKKGYTEKEMSDWKDKASKRQSGMNNGNARSDLTKESIVDVIVAFVNDTNRYEKNILKKEILDLLKNTFNVSSRIIVNRVGTCSELIKMVNIKILELGQNPVIYNPYYRSEDEKKHLSKMASEYNWVTDGISNRQIKRNEIDKYLIENTDYKKGRTIRMKHDYIKEGANKELK